MSSRHGFRASFPKVFVPAIGASTDDLGPMPSIAGSTHLSLLVLDP